MDKIQIVFKRKKKKKRANSKTSSKLLGCMFTEVTQLGSITLEAFLNYKDYWVEFKGRFPLEKETSF